MVSGLVGTAEDQQHCQSSSGCRNHIGCGLQRQGPHSIRTVGRLAQQRQVPGLPAEAEEPDWAGAHRPLPRRQQRPQVGSCAADDRIVLVGATAQRRLFAGGQSGRVPPERHQARLQKGTAAQRVNQELGLRWRPEESRSNRRRGSGLSAAARVPAGHPALPRANNREEQDRSAVQRPAGLAWCPMRTAVIKNSFKACLCDPYCAPNSILNILD